MATDTAAIQVEASSGSQHHWRGWLVTAVCGLALGLLLGVGFNGSYTHGKWSALAGLVVGLVSALATRAHPVLVSLGAGLITMATSVTMVVIHQRSIGYWPITDESTIENYGTATMAAMRLAAALLFLVCVPCVVASTLAASARRREA
jgi:hypothetical protein